MNRLLLNTGGDIPFPEAQLTIHQPTLKEIALIGESEFLVGCQFLNFSKERLSEEDKNLLVNRTNFEVLMSVINDNSNTVIRAGLKNALLVLFLMFPQYEIKILPSGFLFQKEGDTTSHFIDNNNFEKFRELLSEIFCLKDLQTGLSNSNREYNPGGPMAKRLAEKFRKRREKLAKIKGGGTSEFFSIFDSYLSILAVGEHKDKNELAQYSIYQLLDEFKRFQKEQAYRTWLKLKTTFGAKDVKDVDDWMGDLYAPPAADKEMMI